MILLKKFEGVTCSFMGLIHFSIFSIHLSVKKIDSGKTIGKDLLAFLFSCLSGDLLFQRTDVVGKAIFPLLNTVSF